MNRPQLFRADALKIAGVAELVSAGPLILGIRGYFKDMGKPGVNDRGIYDDAAFIIGPGDDEFRSFNWNTDPSKQSPGMAVLQPGEYDWAKGIHGMHHLNLANARDKAAYEWLLAHPGQDHPDPAYRLTYWAFRQASPMMVLRDGKTLPEIAPITSYIDGHHGGLNGTSSEGCQTCPIEQWQEMRSYGYDLMDKYNTPIIHYKLILTE